MIYTVEKSFSLGFFVRIRALVNPPSIKSCEIAMNIPNIPTRPYSVGLRSRAKIIPMTKLTPRASICSTKLQDTPRTVFCFKDSGIGKKE